MRIEIKGQAVEVTYLTGRPWYVSVCSLRTGLWRTIWHRDNNRPIGPLARLAIAAAAA